MLEAGNVYLPHSAIAAWVEDFVQEVTSFPNGRHDDQVDAMTQALNRLRDSGSRFHIPESQIVLDPFAIPEEWPRGFGLAVSPGGVAAICGARNPSGRIYLYAEHQLPHAEPSENARAIKAWGEWVPGVLSAVSVPGSNSTRERIAQIYREQGLTMNVAYEAEEAAGYRLWELLATNKVRVFASLSAFLRSYRIGDENALFQQCCAALIAGGEFMRSA
jgi:hypothetical protein